MTATMKTREIHRTDRAALASSLITAAIVAAALASARAIAQGTSGAPGTPAQGTAGTPAPSAAGTAAQGSGAPAQGAASGAASSPASLASASAQPNATAAPTGGAAGAAPQAAAGFGTAQASVSVALAALPEDPEFPPDAIIRTNSSLMALALSRPARYAKQPVAPGTIEAMSLFAVRSPEERHFGKHDLIQIIVREASRAKTGQMLDTKKDYTLAAEVAWANFSFDAFGQPGVATSSGQHDAPVFEAIGKKKLKGEGDYDRSDEFVTRMTAEVIEVLPNGNLVLEARTTITNDKEATCIKLTGMCRPEDITSGNTVLSNQIHDLKIEKMNTGFVKDAADKGILAQILDAIFAF